MINPSNYSREDITQDELPHECNIAHFNEKNYNTYYKTNFVTCYDLQGTVKWKFKNENVLNGPRGISVDNDGNVYVIGNSSTNVTVVSADGQHHKEKLAGRNDIVSPYSLNYDKRTNQLLIANYGKNTLIFTLV